ncbi:MAG TPA: FG-GAP-like repeat-containing protein [Kofleriaceae bacterium]|jgi:LmbE family N-acetylglucosaminyl deacetylase|nr:FG-GAP-like repeat-containing protein [Kofleriaceae bacterium]
MDRRLAAIALVGLAACGDNELATGEPLAPAADLTIVAHQDDDLIFMQPDVLEAVKRGDGVTNVYVTAGNGTKGVDRAENRYSGLMEAYALAANATAWKCGYIEIAGHTAEHCRLDERRVSLVFLAYPDGGKEGELEPSLLHLWEGSTTNVETISRETSRYDREQLVATVAQIIRITQPSLVRTLEVASTHGRDHSDHMLVGALTVLALARANSNAELLSYRGYETSTEPANKIPPIFTAAFDVLARYEACVAGCAPCGDACTTIDASHVAWLSRRYAVGFRQLASGRVRIGTSCIAADGSLAPCETTPSWHIDRAGELRTNDTCLAAEESGAVTTGLCLGGPSRRFFLDDEGHLWSGLPPAPTTNMDYAHLNCLAATDDGRLALQLCGADSAPTWTFAPQTVATTRGNLGITATGRDVRLGDVTGDGKADLCAIGLAGGLWCAPGDGAGGFTFALQLDDPTAPLAIDPSSLTLGDVDGDHLVDACGRDDNGILCALAATDFAAERWSPSFNDVVAKSSTSASLTAVDANADGIADLCGVDMTGVVCAPHGLTAQSTLRSAWPVTSPLVWPADLDGDGQADWCAATDDGPMCAVQAQSGGTTDGQPWSFSLHGIVDIIPANSATVAFADIDGDGRADYCTTHEDRVVCARSQGRAFGPRTIDLAILPAQSTASALWLGDLDGDGRADPCVASSNSDDVVCAVSP